MNIKRPQRLVLIRHGESDRNKVKKGSTYFADEDARRTVMGIPDQDIALTPFGKRQAEMTSFCLRERYGVPDYFYDSGYRRTIETREGNLSAYLPSERKKIKIRSALFIRERDSGYTYDMTEEEAERMFPYLREYWANFGGFFARPPGGESLAQVCERVHAFLNSIFRDRAGQNVFVVTHGGTIRSFRYLLERWDHKRALRWPPGESPKNCGVTVYEYDHTEERLVLKDYNQVFWK